MFTSESSSSVPRQFRIIYELKEGNPRDSVYGPCWTIVLAAGKHSGLTRQKASKYALLTMVDSSLRKYPRLTEEASQAVLNNRVSIQNQRKILVDREARCHV
jgi:hypothetical protein